MLNTLLLKFSVIFEFQDPVENFFFLAVITPSTINAQPIAKIKKSAGTIIAHVSFTVPAYRNNKDKNIRAIPAMVSPLTLCNSKFFSRSVIKTISQSECNLLPQLNPTLTFFPCKQHKHKWYSHNSGGYKYWL
jgi:hypothetical protein